MHAPLGLFLYPLATPLTALLVCIRWIKDQQHRNRKQGERKPEYSPGEGIAAFLVCQHTRNDAEACSSSDHIKREYNVFHFNLPLYFFGNVLSERSATRCVPVIQWLANQSETFRSSFNFLIPLF